MLLVVNVITNLALLLNTYYILSVPSLSRMSLSATQYQILKTLSMTLSDSETIEAAIALLRQKIFETLP